MKTYRLGEVVWPSGGSADQVKDIRLYSTLSCTRPLVEQAVGCSTQRRQGAFERAIRNKLGPSAPKCSKQPKLKRQLRQDDPSGAGGQVVKILGFGRPDGRLSCKLMEQMQVGRLGAPAGGPRPSWRQLKRV